MRYGYEGLRLCRRRQSSLHNVCTRDSNPNRMHHVNSIRKQASNIIPELAISTSCNQPLILKRNLLALDASDDNLGRVLGNDLVIVEHLKLL